MGVNNLRGEIMEERQLMVLGIDSSQAEEGIAQVAKDLTQLKKTASEIGTILTKAFDPLLKSLDKVEISIHAMSASLVEVTGMLNALMLQLAIEGSSRVFSATTDEIISTTELINASIEGGIGAILGVSIEKLVPIITKALGDLGVALGIGTGGLLATIGAIGAAIAAIVLLITNWDSIQATVTEGFSAFMDGAGGAWESLYNIIQPVMDFVRTTIDDLWEKHLKPFWDNLCSACTSIGEGIATIWNEILMPIISWIIDIYAPRIISVIDLIVGAVSVVVAFVADIVGAVFEIIGGLIKFIAGVFTGDWEKAWGGIVEIFKGVFDGIAGIVKGVFNGVIWAINIIIGKIYSVIAGVLNGIGGVAQFIGNIFGQDWSFRVPSNPPQIPHLAKGAVLPANRPFLAVVGDQKHGTNIEAPLTTIQEAVGLVMGDHIAAMMAGFEALLKEQQATRRTIEGIEIGDAVIGRAAERYGRKIKDSLKLRSSGAVRRLQSVLGHRKKGAMENACKAG